MRIAHVLTQATGGPVQVAAGLVRGLRAAGHDARIVGPAPRTSTSTGHDLPVTEAVVASTRDLAGFRALRRALAGFAPDVVHAQDRRAALAIGISGTDAPAFTTYHGVPTACVSPDGRLGVNGRPLTARARGALLADAALARRFRRVTTPSADMRRYLVDVVGVPAQRVTVIPNAVDPSAAPARAGRVVRRFGTLSSFATAKATPALVAAFLALARKVPDVELWLAGDGPDRPRCDALVAGAGMGSRVRMIGHTEDPPAFLADIDAFVLSSVEENLPLALLEAMAQGMPCVATAVGGVGEVITDGSGLLVPPGDVAALTGAMARLATDAAFADALGQAGREAVLGRFQLHQQVSAMLALYAEVRG